MNRSHLNLSVAQKIEITSNVRHVIRDHVAAVAASTLKTNGDTVYVFGDASRGKFVVERDERGRSAFRFAVLA